MAPIRYDGGERRLLLPFRRGGLFGPSSRSKAEPFPAGQARIRATRMARRAPPAGEAPAFYGQTAASPPKSGANATAG